MENENRIPATSPEMDSFQREERCRKTIKTVGKAIVMRIFVSVILIWAVLQTNMEFWVIGLMAFVLIINLTGLLPLIMEWKKRHKELKEIVAEDE